MAILHLQHPRLSMLRLRHIVIALLRVRQLLRCQHTMSQIAVFATSQIGLPVCCICSAPDLRITHAAFVTLSFGGLDGGSQWVILFNSTMSKNSQPPIIFSLCYRQYGSEGVTYVRTQSHCVTVCIPQ